MSSTRLARFLVTTLLAAIGVSRLQSQVTVSNTGFQDLSVFTVSGSDLLQTNLASTALSPTNGYSTFANSLTGIMDGSFGSAGTDSGASVGFASGTSVTFLFDLTTNTRGYDLSSIKTYAAWDAGRDGQEYTVTYSTATDPTTFLALASAGPFDVTGNVPAGPAGRTLITIADLGGGTLVGGVAGLRFTFTSYENGGTAYREIDVQGTPTAIPESGTAPFIFGAAALTLAALGRRTSKAKHRTPGQD